MFIIVKNHVNHCYGYVMLIIVNPVVLSLFFFMVIHVMLKVYIQLFLVFSDILFISISNADAFSCCSSFDISFLKLFW